MKFRCNWRVVQTLALVCVSSLCASTRAFALPPAAPAAQAETALSAEDKYVHARHLLERGTNFEFAIVTLRAALTSDPENAKYHNELGCALADRAASIAHAAIGIKMYAEFHKRYLKDLARWQAAQKGKIEPLDSDAETVESRLGDAARIARDAARANMTEDRWRAMVASSLATDKKLEALYAQRFTERSPPPAEPILSTSDDGRPFKRTLEDAKPVFSALAKESEDEFKKSERLAEGNDQRARFVQTRAWAELMLSRHVIVLGAVFPFDKAKILGDLRKAVDLNADSPDLWRAYADAIVEASKEPTRLGAKDLSDALAAYRKALSLERRDSLHINARIFLLLEPFSLSPIISTREATDALSGAIHADPQNAFLGYVQAKIRINEDAAAKPSIANQPEPASEEFSLVERANELPSYSTDLYEEAVPAELNVAWHYDIDRVFNASLFFARLSRDVCTSASAELQAGNKAQAERRLLAVVAMGNKIEAAQPPYPSVEERNAKSFLTGSSLILQNGYNGLAKYYDSVNDSANAGRAREAADTVKREALSRTDSFMAEESFGYSDVY